jgi:ElaB/YqjD/DUF883 family membrane-anchored ribosome-binding protein
MNSKSTTSPQASTDDRQKADTDFVNVMAEAGDALRKLGEGKLRDARSLLGEGQAAIEANARELTAVTRDYVQANPWRAVGIAALGGVLLGALLARR